MKYEVFMSSTDSGRWHFVFDTVDECFAEIAEAIVYGTILASVEIKKGEQVILKLSGKDCDLKHIIIKYLLSESYQV